MCQFKVHGFCKADTVDAPCFMPIQMTRGRARLGNAPTPPKAIANGGCVYCHTLKGFAHVIDCFMTDVAEEFQSEMEISELCPRSLVNLRLKVCCTGFSNACIGSGISTATKQRMRAPVVVSITHLLLDRNGLNEPAQIKGCDC